MNKEQNPPKHHSPQHLPAIAIVTVTRNRCDLLLRILSQVQELEYPKDKLDIFILDGASADDTVEKVRQRFPKVHITSNKINKGIAAAENTVITSVLESNKKYKYIWFLDDDVVIESQTLMPLVVAAEREPNIAVIGSAVYDPDERDTIITEGLRVVWEKSGLSYHIPKSGETEKVFDVEIVPACSSLTRADLFHPEKVGLWDEHFWMYWPDNDWCLRALRNGHRVCCHGRSRVWHRNWATIKRYFYTPYTTYSSVRGALLFYLRHNPLKSLAGIRIYMLKSYLKAAFETFTVRPNFSRAYVEGVEDFLKGHLSEKDTSLWEDATLSELEEICRSLVGKIKRNPRIILNQIDDETQKAEIKNFFQCFFDQIRWEEISVNTGADQLDPREPLSDYLFYHFLKLLLRLLKFFTRKDVIISSVGLLEYNIGAAKYTVLLEPSLKGCIRKNRIFRSFWGFVRIITKGLKAVYFDLPRALKNCSALREAVGAYPNLPQPSPAGIEAHKTRLI